MGKKEVKIQPESWEFYHSGNKIEISVPLGNIYLEKLNALYTSRDIDNVEAFDDLIQFCLNGSVLSDKVLEILYNVDLAYEDDEGDYVLKPRVKSLILNIMTNGQGVGTDLPSQEWARQRESPPTSSWPR